jgi:hypothetical protein
VPALDEVRRFAQRALEDGLRIDRPVVRPAVHHHLADDRPDPVRFGGPERGVEAGLVDRAVDHGGRGARGGERAPGERGEPVGRRLVEVALKREHVAIEPGQQVQPGTEPGVGNLGQMRVEVDEPRQDDPRAQIDGGGGRLRSLTRGTHESQAAGLVDQEQAVRLMARAAGRERCEEPGAQRERGSSGQRLGGHGARC